MSMFLESKKKGDRFFYIPSFLLGVLSVALLFGVMYSIMSATTTLQMRSQGELTNKIKLIEPVNAAEIYPEFICGCCGRPLDPVNPCCGDMKQKINYIDQQIEAGLSKDEIMIAAVKEFGLASLAKEGTEQEIKNILIDQAPVDAPKIIFEQTSYDFGQVSQADGIVFTYFPIKNKGESNLVIDKLSTSCGCTLASIVYQGEEGPTFTMPGHGKENPANWSVAIAPGDEAQLKIYYDPNTHGEQKEDVLPVTRTISIFSNDPVEFEKQVRIDLNQTP